MTGPVAVPVARGVWLAAGDGRDLPVSTHPGDRRAARSMPGGRAREFLTGRGLLRRLLAQVCPGAADAPVLAGPDGAPRLHGHPGLGVSVAHDAGTAAAAVAVGRAVGVDVQHPPHRPSRALARRLLGERAAELDALPAPAAARELAWVWTAQEACAKATGRGLAVRPWTIDVPPGARSGRWRGLSWHSPRDRFGTPLSCAFTASPGGLGAPGEAIDS
ncbi:4'-phosphopantetheinyl transferase family protein [Streptomyces cyaneogriseus]|uniref:4'-phosphopantetheinyl transferase family protein n=1 Tax=Streptomyces cyaneogriseus TaxID=68192 RepID=UPI000A6FB473|nr:4'-phosphopantetheinyl transferase superfamily protein [Streptomyces cyaneogriseus]